MELTECGPEVEAIREELEEILGSEVFSAAHRSRSFLRYVVERSLEGSAPKEYEIAVEVLGRGVAYDPAVDATVRVEASRLRSRLLQYYATRGQADPILIEIPKGGYRATFRRREAIAGTDPSAPEQQPLPAASQPAEAELSTGAKEIGLEDGAADATKGPPDAARHGWPRIWTGVALAGVLAIAALGLLLSRSNARGRASAGPIRSLAVLPLQNLSGSESERYFADGMTDELTTELAHIPGLKVVSRTSAAQSQGSRKSLRQIARELDVDAVVEGSVVRSGGRVRITAQLIDARDDRHLWAQAYEESMEDVLSLQDKVVREIASQTQAALAAGTPAKAPVQVDPDAYDAYLRGLYFLHRRKAHQSAAYFERAISMAPSYAAAYAGLAEALGSEAVVGEGAAPDVVPRALEAAVRAIELDPNNGDAYAALAWIKILNGGDWTAIRQDLETSLRLSPSSSVGELDYSIYLDAMDRREEAVAHMRRALQLDPLSFYVNRQLGSALYFARHYDEALASLQRANEMEPTQHGFVDKWASRVYEVSGNLPEAERYDLASLSVELSEAELKPLHAAFARGGWKAYQGARLNLLLRHPVYGACSSYEVGESYLRLGRHEEALSWLKRGADNHCFWATAIPVDPLLDPLRSDPGYRELLRHAHL